MSASLPRPSRPSLNVPTSSSLSAPTSGSLPVSKRSPTASSAGASPAGTSSAGPSPSGLPRVSSSQSIPASSPSSPPKQPLPSLPPSGIKTIRKTASYNVFPKSPASARPPSSNYASSTATTPRGSQRASSLYTPSRTPSLNTPHASGLNGTAGLGIRSVPSTPPVGTEKSIAERATSDKASSRSRPQSTHGKDKGNVVISVRVRPEAGQNEQSAAAAVASGEWMVNGRSSLISYQGKEGGEYYYDNVFTAHDGNAKVYDASAKRLVRRVMEGYHGTVFAYGMTGTGKTYSMQGTAKQPGVIPLAITDIFSFIRENPEREFLLRVSYLEIYNEKIHDLLTTAPQASRPGPPQQEEIKLREDDKRGVYATPLREEIVQSPTQLLRVIARGDHSRRTSSTQYNARSSRSHAVVQIVVESRERNAGGSSASTDMTDSEMIPGGARISTLSLIDLAGSERAAESKERRTEGAHINKSLLTLGTVVSKLSGSKDKSGLPMDKEGKHLPYRDSKLTRLLQQALSGGSLISILCTIQIGSANSAATTGQHTVETLNTLKFAARARNNIVSHAKKSEESHADIGDAGSRALLDRYRIEIVELRKQLEGQKTVNQKAQDEEEERQRQAEDEARHEEQMLEMHLARTALKERIEHLNRLILSSKSIGVNNRTLSQSSSTTKNAQGKSVRSSSGSILSSASDLGRKSSKSSIKSASTLKENPTQEEARTPTEISPPPEEEEEESIDELGDGNASLATQVKNLQADLADKNRYIVTLEKRVWHARRASKSQTSNAMSKTFSSPIPEDEPVEGPDAIIRDKDVEIADLRARLDDKERIVAALKSAARKRDVADSRPSSVSPGVNVGDRFSPRTSLNSSQGILSNGQRRISGGSARSNSQTDDARRSLSSPHSSLSKVTSANHIASDESPTSPKPRVLALASGGPAKHVEATHGVDEMTRILDEMIRQKAETEGAMNKPLPPRPGSQQIAANSSVARALASTTSTERRVATNNGTHPAEHQSTLTNGNDAFGSRPHRKPVPSPNSAINTDNTMGMARSKGSPIVDPGKLSGWESDIQRRRSLKKESRERAEVGGGTNHDVKPPNQSNGNHAAGAMHPQTSNHVPPLSYENNTGNHDYLQRPTRDWLRVADIGQQRDISPGSEGTAILDEVQEGGHSKRNSIVGLGIEAKT
ncbi:MAG: hypothetical protein Q9159_000849 [Coniocarpon cinnabarinum]